MVYTLWELAKHPEYQTKLRTELDHYVSAKGDASFTAADLNSIDYLNAVIKVCSRWSKLLRTRFDGMLQETLRIHNQYRARDRP